MTYRKLRIAWSVACGVVGVLLIALWVRSYWEDDQIQGPTPAGNHFTSYSWQGRILARVSTEQTLPASYQRWRWRVTSTEDEKRINERHNIDWELPPALSIHIRKNVWSATVAHRLLVLATAVCSIVPWLPLSRRFTLRKLLIATTLIALALGLIVWLR